MPDTFDFDAMNNWLILVSDMSKLLYRLQPHPTCLRRCGYVLDSVSVLIRVPIRPSNYALKLFRKLLSVLIFNYG